MVTTLGKGVALIFSVCAVFAAVNAEEEGKAVPFNQVPKAVQATILAQARGSKVIDVEVVTKQGRQIYEADVTIAGGTMELSVDAAGVLLKIRVERDDGDEKQDSDGDNDRKREKK